MNVEYDEDLHDYFENRPLKDIVFSADAILFVYGAKGNEVEPETYPAVKITGEIEEADDFEKANVQVEKTYVQADTDYHEVEE